METRTGVRAVRIERVKRPIALFATAVLMLGCTSPTPTPSPTVAPTAAPSADLTAQMRWYLEDYRIYPVDPAPKIAERIERRMLGIDECR